MVRDPLIFAATSDLAGKMRGKAFPSRKLENVSNQAWVGCRPTG